MKNYLILTFFLTLIFFSNVEAKLKNYTIEITNFENHQEVMFSGDIKTPWEPKKEIKDVLNRLESNKDILVYIDKSWGGVIASFKKIIKGLKSKCSGSDCTITTYVEEYCGSACIDLLMAGDKRMMAHNAKLGFHRAWMIHPSIPIKSKKKMAKEYIDMGVEPNWMNANLDLFLVSKKTAFGVSANWLFWSDAHEANFITDWSPENFLEAYRSSH